MTTPLVAKGKRFVPAAPLAALVLLTAGCGMSFSLPGTGKAHSSHAKERLVAAVHLSPHHRAGRSHLSKGLRHPATAHVVSHTKSFSAQHRYAVKILPVLDASTRVFDSAVAAAATGASDSALDSTCSQYGDQISILASEFDGVPHPWPWYTQPSSMHHNFMGVYNYMLGAIQSCQTAVASGDNSTAASAISDMKTADDDMHNADNYTRWLTHQP